VSSSTYPLKPFVLATLLVVSAACGDDAESGDAQRFCGAVQENRDALVEPRLTSPADAATLVELYRQVGELAPLAIEEHWDALTLLYATASTVDPDDPESRERVKARAFATERSAITVHEWLLRTCAVDIGPVATIVPPAPAVPTTTPATIP